MRQTWDDYFLDIAKVVATRSTCDRLHVGCVLVKDKRIIATGYNGSLPGEPHCDDVGHDMEGNHCKRTIHAELNALLQCAKNGTVSENATAYVTHTPCPSCEKALKMAGIINIEYKEEY